MAPADRQAALERELKLLDSAVERSFPDVEDQATAHHADRQGLGPGDDRAAAIGTNDEPGAELSLLPVGSGDPYAGNTSVVVRQDGDARPGGHNGPRLGRGLQQDRVEHRAADTRGAAGVTWLARASR